MIEFILYLFIVCCYQLESSQSNAPVAYQPLLCVQAAATRNPVGFVDMDATRECQKALDNFSASGMREKATDGIAVLGQELARCNARKDVLDRQIAASQAAADAAEAAEAAAPAPVPARLLWFCVCY